VRADWPVEAFVEHTRSARDASFLSFDLLLTAGEALSARRDRDYRSSDRSCERVFLWNAFGAGDLTDTGVVGSIRPPPLLGFILPVERCLPACTSSHQSPGGVTAYSKKGDEAGGAEAPYRDDVRGMGAQKNGDHRSLI
jgi:hypothetical protein